MASIGWPGESVDELLSDLIETWHEHRVPIVLVCFALLIVLRGYLHLTQETEQLLVFPKIYGTESAKEAERKGEKEQSARQEEPSAALPAVVQEDGEKPTAKKAANGPRRIKGELHKESRGSSPTGESTGSGPREIQTLVFFSSITGGTEQIARDYVQRLASTLEDVVVADDADPGRNTTLLPPRLLDLSEVDYDEYFITPPKQESKCEGGSVEFFYLFLIPSYNIDTINDSFLEHLRETHHDFRIDTAPLAGLLGYSVFGFGDREGWPTEEEGFCFQAKEVDRWLAKLTGRKRAFPLGVADTKGVVVSDVERKLAEWSEGVVDVVALLARTGSLGEGIPGSGDPVESDDDDDGDEKLYDDGEVVLEGGYDGPKPKTKLARLRKPGAIDDVEDLGRIIRDSGASAETNPGATTKQLSASAPVAVDFTTYDKRSGAAPAKPAVKEMVPKNSPTHAALTKQGYAIVGSHSGVKICRWTKSALRGRGSCYKFSFYGIHSHRCMEATPSLSCSNKCVFCWRHGTNPVGTRWRWAVDPPELVFAGVKAGHYQKIRSMRGVPGVRAERFAEALRVRHCALSLVGEPIFYPHINELLALLHAERISSFLVCNAQHPDELAALRRVTQLYVSIDASNRDSLRRIDRPLHRDFWERFLRCLDILRERRHRQRTVFRLTLVKGFNIDDEVRGYADLVERALPCFVEVKGVTYCGTSASSGAGLTMANVPFYAEVCDFVTALERELRSRGLAYGLAAEHAHSCCVLLASERFRVDGRWHTLIDYDRFFDLLEEKGPDGDFGPEDYMGPETPEWATWGNGGFDPRDQRVDRKGRPIAAD